VWRRLKGYTPAVGAGAAVAATTLAAGQLASSSAGSAPPPRGGASEGSAARCTGQDAEPICRVDVVCYKVYFVIALNDTFNMLDFDLGKILFGSVLSVN
jgi:hypothetical protein